MKIILSLVLFSVQTFAARPEAPACRLPSQPTIQDDYVVHRPQANCEIISLGVLTSRECKSFVKEKRGACYQLGAIYARSDLKKKMFTACFACVTLN